MRNCGGAHGSFWPEVILQLHNLDVWVLFLQIFLIFDKRMPRSLSFCYKEISSNLHDLEMAYGRQYNAGDIARALAQTIKDGEQNNIHLSNLHDFITSFISTNNQLSLTIAKDFNLN